MYAFICTQKHNVCLITSFKCFIYNFNVLHTFFFLLMNDDCQYNTIPCFKITCIKLKWKCQKDSTLIMVGHI